MFLRLVSHFASVGQHFWAQTWKSSFLLFISGMQNELVSFQFFWM